MAATPAERALRSRIAAHRSWANTTDPSERTRPARDKFLARFEAQVDPEGTLLPADRARGAAHARSAHFAALALKSARSRRLARQYADDAETAEAELRTSGGAA